MRGSFLVRRVFLVTILGIALTAFLTTLMYTLIVQTAFTQLRENELTPKANALGEVVRAYLDGEVSAEALSMMLSQSDGENALLGANALILDDKGDVLFSSDGIAKEYYRLMAKEFDGILEGETVTTPRKLQLVRANVVIVGTPVFGEDGSVLAGVILLVPMVEILAAISSMNGALIMSVCIALPIVAVCTYVLADRFAKPLRQMNQVALSMAGGTFTARADPSQGGEIGELARSLNFLARELSGTISALTLERNRLKDVMDGLSEGIAAVDREGRITHSNVAMESLFAGSRTLSDGSESSGRLRLIPCPDLWQDFDKVIQTGEPTERNIELGNTTLHAHVTPLLDDSGSVAGAVGMVSDITKSERLERTRRDYVANVSHELRTPLTALRGLVEPMRDGLVRTEEARQRYYGIILRETMRLSRLIDDLMELSRLQSGTLSLECSPVSMSTLLEDIREKYQTTAEDHDLSFCLTFDPKEIPMVWSNADRVEEALVILLDNAIKYTPANGKITLGAIPIGDRLAISVSDTGIGISPEDQEHVFDRFYKVDKAHSGMGSGLGLSIAREMLRHMDSDLTLESELGRGSTFRFSLPIC